MNNLKLLKSSTHISAEQLRSFTDTQLEQVDDGYHIYDSFESFRTSEPKLFSVFGGNQSTRRLSAAYSPSGSKIVVQNSDGVIRSTDPVFNRYMNRLADELDKMFPPRMSDNGFLLSGAATSFSKIKTIAGMKMIPMNVPTLNNVSVQKDYGLKPFPQSELDLEIARTVLRLCLKAGDPSSGTISRISSTTIPYFTSAMPLKQRIVREAFADLPRIIDASYDDNLDAMYALGIIPYSVLVQRLQQDSVVDGVGKIRRVRGLEGVFLNADKRKAIDALDPKLEGAAARVRTAYALSGRMSYLMSCFMQHFRGYLDRYEFTWKQRSFNDMRDKMHDLAWVRGFDATQMDTTLPYSFALIFCKHMSEQFGGAFDGLFSYMNHAGIFVPDPDGSGRVGLSKSGVTSASWVGLSSGRPDNPDMGKMWMTTVYLIMLKDVTRSATAEDFARELGFANLELAIDMFLRGKARYRQLNMGDDEFLGGVNGTEATLNALDQLSSSGVSFSPYCKIEFERVIAFLGGVATSTGGANPRLDAVEPNAVSQLSNFFCPERDFGGQMRKFAGQGRLLALEHYSRSSTAAEVWREACLMWRRYTDFPDLMSIITKHARENPVADQGLREIDIMALEDPSKIYYRVSLDDLHSSVRELLIQEVPADLIYQTFKPWRSK